MHIRLLFLLPFFVLSLSACQKGMVRPIQGNVSTSIYAVDYVPSTWNLPMGAVVPEGSHLILHRQPSSEGVGLGIMFGVVGVMIANESMKSSTREAISSVDALKDLDPAAETRAILRDFKTDGELGNALTLADVAPAGRRYEVRPFLLLEADRNQDAQVSVIVRVAELGGDGKSAWTGQYMRHLPHVMGLDQLNTATGAAAPERLREDTLAALRLTLRVMVLDLTGRLATGDETPVGIRPTGVVSWNIFDSMEGRLVGELDGRYQLVRTNFGENSVFYYGMQILNRDQAILTAKAGAGSAPKAN